MLQPQLPEGVVVGTGVGVMKLELQGFQPLGCEPPFGGGGRLPVEIGGGTLHGGREPVGAG